MDQGLEKAKGPEEALFVCLHPLLALVPASALLWMKVHIRASEAEIRQAALGEGEGSKRGHGLMLLCMSRHGARGQELVPSQERRCQGQGQGSSCGCSDHSRG